MSPKQEKRYFVEPRVPKGRSAEGGEGKPRRGKPLKKKIPSGEEESSSKKRASLFPLARRVGKNGHRQPIEKGSLEKGLRWEKRDVVKEAGKRRKERRP